jgi:hypothetical protein
MKVFLVFYIVCVLSPGWCMAANRHKNNNIVFAGAVQPSGHAIEAGEMS